MPVVSEVVIVGAGFGGLAAAKELAKSGERVTIVDRHNYHTFQPLLYQVATAGLNAADVAYAVRGIFQGQSNVSFRQAEVTGVDWVRSTLELDDGELPFDHLIVAAGATAAYFGIEGAAENGFPLYVLSDAITLRNHILSRFEAADADAALIDDGALCFVVVGGGPTGVEVAGALSELFVVLRKDFPDLDPSGARIVLVEMADTLLQPFSAASQRHARARLVDMGVDVRTNDAVMRVTPNRVELRSGTELDAHTLVWAAGVRANPLADALAVPTGRSGRIVVGADLRIDGHTNAFAIGDVAAITGADGQLLPMVAQVAIQSGRHAAREIAGARHRPFRYRDKGTMATIGRRAAVAELPLHVRLSGTPAWMA
ncbi:MAG: FAD-dependent oxidoreductase, partial [Bacteroidetes bacterium 13_1_20CM_4_60_6]